MAGIAGLITKMSRERRLSRSWSGWSIRFVMILRMVTGDVGRRVARSICRVGHADGGHLCDGMPLRSEQGDSGARFLWRGVSAAWDAPALEGAGPRARMRPSARIWFISAEEDRSFPAGIERHCFRGSWRIRTERPRCCSMIAMACAVSIITSRATHSISPRKPKRSLESARNCGGWIQGAWESSPLVALSWKTGRSSRVSRFCRRLRHGSFETAQWRGRSAILPKGMGRAGNTGPGILL